MMFATSFLPCAGDARTATDSRIFLLRFLERFPRFRNTPFYVSGEAVGSGLVQVSEGRHEQPSKDRRGAERVFDKHKRVCVCYIFLLA